MSRGERIIVADDEPNLRRVLAGILGREGYDVLLASNGEEALGLVDSGVGVVITDLRMPRIDGMTLLRTIVRDSPDIPVIIITAHGTVDTAVEALKLGAFDYIEKPFEQEQLRSIVAKALDQHRVQQDQPRIAVTDDDTQVPGRFGLVGDSAGMQQVYAVIDKVADTPSTVLITGESGTGKELVAKALHQHSAREPQPFIKINCAAIPKTLMESELFGYEKGAFTGAVGQKPGRFELADTGTIFLDEIGEIPVEMQVKLLRALQESEFERVGGIKTLKVDVRVITATNRDLEREVKQGNFREDLYYRLNVVPLRLPPLRERKEDIAHLCEHIVRRFNERLKKNARGLTPDAMERLMGYSWPGNIRELENVLERTILFTDAEWITAGDLPAELTASSAPTGREPTGQHILPQEDEGKTLKDIVRAETERVERDLIIQALDETAGNVTQAAKRLGISRKSMQMKMKEFGLREA